MEWYIAIKKNKKDFYELIQWFTGYIIKWKKQSTIVYNIERCLLHKKEDKIRK